MTLIPFSPEALDGLALRLLDLAADARRMAEKSREFGLKDCPLHGNKLHEWLARMEAWSQESEARLEAALVKARGARRAREARAEWAGRPPGKPAKQAKKTAK